MIMSTKILLIDDDSIYSTKLQTEAKAFGLEMVIADNLEDGMEMLRGSRKLKAVVLDGRCFLTDDKQEPVRSNFVSHALRQIGEIEDDYSRIIPFCINTETPADFAEDMVGIAEVFAKETEHNMLFQHINSMLKALPETIVREEFEAVFSKIQNRFDEDDEELLVSVLQTIGKSDRAEIATHLGLLRRLLETLIDGVCEEKLHKPFDSFLRGEGSRTRRILEAMRYQVLPIELYDSAIHLYRIGSRYGNHQDPIAPGTITLHPNKYTYQRMVYALLELIVFLL